MGGREPAAAGLGLLALVLGVAAKVLLKKEALVGSDPVAVALGFAAASAPVLIPAWLLLVGLGGEAPLVSSDALPAILTSVPAAAWGLGPGWCVANLAGAFFRQRAYRLAPMGTVGVFTTTAGAVAGAVLLLLRGGGHLGPALACLGLVALMAAVLLAGAARACGPGAAAEVGRAGTAAAAGPGAADAVTTWAPDAAAAWAAYGVAAALAGLGGGVTVVVGSAAALLGWLAVIGVRRGVAGRRPRAAALTPRAAAAGVLEGLAWLAYAQALALAPLVAGSINAFQGLAVVAGGRAALGERVTLRLAAACVLGVGAVAMAVLAG